MIFLFIPIFIFAGVIENNISKVYKSYYPTLKIDNIKIKTYSPITKITSINTSSINPKRINGIIKVNNSYASYKIDGMIKVVKSVSVINKGEFISNLNAELTTIKFKNFPTIPLMNLDGNYISKMYIPANKIIYKYMIKKPYFVNRGEEVQVISKSGNIEIILTGTALQNGNKNQKINVKIDNKIYKVKIIDKGLGEL